MKMGKPPILELLLDFGAGGVAERQRVQAEGLDVDDALLSGENCGLIMSFSDIHQSDIYQGIILKIALKSATGGQT